MAWINNKKQEKNEDIEIEIEQEIDFSGYTDVANEANEKFLKEEDDTNDSLESEEVSETYQEVEQESEAEDKETDSNVSETSDEEAGQYDYEYNLAKIVLSVDRLSKSDQSVLARFLSTEEKDSISLALLLNQSHSFVDALKMTQILMKLDPIDLGAKVALLDDLEINKLIEIFREQDRVSLAKKIHKSISDKKMTILFKAVGIEESSEIEHLSKTPAKNL